MSKTVQYELDQPKKTFLQNDSSNESILTRSFDSEVFKTIAAEVYGQSQSMEEKKIAKSPKDNGNQ